MGFGVFCMVGIIGTVVGFGTGAVGVAVGLDNGECRPDGDIGRADTDIAGAGRGVYVGCGSTFLGCATGCGAGMFGTVVGFVGTGVGAGAGVAGMRIFRGRGRTMKYSPTNAIQSAAIMEI